MPPSRSTGASRWSGRSMRKNLNIARQLGHAQVPEGLLVSPRRSRASPTSGS